jgi:CheY-like chemotaxis protein
MTEKLYTTFQIADICHVRPTTVIKWANRNLIKTYTTPGGHRRVRQADLLDFLKQYNIPIPPELSSAGPHVMIVEDEKPVGMLLCKAFQSLPHNIEVEWIRDGVEALLSLGKRTPQLIVLDVVMPVMDGAHVLAKLRSDARTQKIKVIGITGERLSSDRLAFMKDNTDAFFFKPFIVKELICKAMSLMNLPMPTKAK